MEEKCRHGLKDSGERVGDKGDNSKKSLPKNQKKKKKKEDLKWDTAEQRGLKKA